MHVMGAIIRRLLSQLPGVDSNPPFPHENCDSSLLLKHTRRCPSEVKFDGYPVAFNGRDLRPQPLAKRQACLRALGALRLPGRLAVRTVRRRPGAAARRREAGPRGCRQQGRRASAGTGARSRRPRGARRTGNDGSCSRADLPRPAQPHWLRRREYPPESFALFL